MPNEMKIRNMMCNVPVGGPYKRPGRINALDEYGQPGYSSRALDVKIMKRSEPRWEISDSESYFGMPFSPYKVWNIPEDKVVEDYQFW